MILRVYLKGNYYSGDPFFTSMMIGGKGRSFLVGTVMFSYIEWWICYAKFAGKYL